MKFVSAVPFREALAFYRICEAYQNAFLATLERCIGPTSDEQPPNSVFFIKEEGGYLGDVVHQELIQHLAVSVEVQLVHDAALSEDR